jgi:RNA polymerase sigma-B factor
MSAAVQPAPAGFEDLDRIAEQYAADVSHCADDQAARMREDLVRAALPMAERLARRYRMTRDAEDVLQVARLGLLKAVNRYDPQRGSFTAYAISCIVGEIKRHFRDRSWDVHVPRRMQELALAVRRTHDHLVQELGRVPTGAEVAGRCAMPDEDFAAARLCVAGHQSLSLDQPTGMDGITLGDRQGETDPALESVADEVSVSALIERLPPRERRILALRFQGDRTQSEIAEELGLSQMHVSRLLSRVLGWLREALLGDTVPPWPGAPDPEYVERLVVGVQPQPDGGLLVRVWGELDRDEAERLRRTLLTAISRMPAGRKVVLDLRRMPLLDASGIAVLLAVQEAARVRRITVTAVGLQPFVRRIALASGLGPLLTED